ncbi:hypothetical protein AB0M39_11750 [Streptomyces sp. NPDC051907]|uniref:hypothetical protein n=1 Tax=Streptomyces sp. NPDC051907 TaxID=3155284 RepID=UPI0034498DB1
MTVQVSFEAPPGGGVQQLGDRVFRLHEVEERMPLPSVVLRTQADQPSVTVQSFYVTEVRGAHPELRSWLTSSWIPAPTNPRVVAGVHRVTGPDASVPLAIARSASPQSPHRARGDVTAGRADLTVEVSFAFERIAPDGRSLPGYVTVLLEFAEPGADPMSEPAPRFDHILRRLDGAPYYPQYVAVDFGTTACTATLHDSREIVARPVDPHQQKALAGSLARVVSGRPAQEAAATEYQEALDRILKTIAEHFPDEACRTAKQLAARLIASASADAEAPLLHAAARLLEREMSDAGETLRRWLALELHRAYDVAFSTPALERMHLIPVAYRGSQKHDLVRPMALSVEVAPRGEGDGLQVAFGEAEQPASNLKAFLGRREPFDLTTRSGGSVPGLTSDVLTAHVYRLLIEGAEKYTVDPATSAPRYLRHLVVTYPTITPPAARDAHVELVRSALDALSVVSEFDEGVAAGLFFVMRAFGGDNTGGLEALRARSRPVEGGDRLRWQQHLLVIDIGGGTTDTALLRLSLSDITESVDEEGQGLGQAGMERTAVETDASPGAAPTPSTRGRRYLLKPEVLGSSGHTQLGGNLLTLRVFYWLKAHIVDALIGWAIDTGRTAVTDLSIGEALRGDDGRPRSLAKAVLRHGLDPELVPADVRVALRAYLPTHYGEDGDAPPGRRGAFETLWNLAEDIKQELGAADREPRSKVITAAEIREIVGVSAPGPSFRLLDAGAAGSSGSEFTADVELDSEGLKQLLRPVIAKAAGVAAQLARTRLARDSDPNLDMIMLSGRSSAMPMVRDTVVEEFTRPVGGDAQALQWNPTAIEAETRYAKQLTSIGAAWGQSIRETHGALVTLPADDDPHAAQTTTLAISTDRLFRSLPCDFTLHGQGSVQHTVLRAGDPFEEIDASGTLARRTLPLRLSPLMEIHRPIIADLSIQWGVYRVGDEATESGYQLRELLWFGNDEARIKPEIYGALQIQQEGLHASLLLCRGVPHHYVPASQHSIREAVPEEHVRDGLITRMPWPVGVRGLRPYGAWSPVVELFPAGPTMGGDDANSTGSMSLSFHRHDSPASDALPGAEAVIPAAALGSRYEFYAMPPGAAPLRIAECEAPSTAHPETAHRVALDAEGQLTVVRGKLRHLTARTLQDVEDYVGAVLTRPMQAGRMEYNPAWDPFTGRH